MQLAGIISSLLLLCLSSSTIFGLENGLAKTPPMGWISWARFTCQTDCSEFPENCISSELYETQAAHLANDGFKELGYEYVNIDDCWSERNRNETEQQLVADRGRFPNGIEPLASTLHSKGLKLGIYGDCGTETCAGYPAQLKTLDNMEDNYFDRDAQTFANWQVDSFKFDGCNIKPDEAEAICPKMSNALNKTTRPILLTCEWPYYQNRAAGEVTANWSLAATSCNLWRYYEDVEDSWLSILLIIDYTIKIQDTIVQYHGPGGWFDPDQLLVGNFGLSFEEAQAQMAIWSLWSAPLFMSNDLRRLAPEFAQILKHKPLIDINQDALGVFALEVGHSKLKPGENVFAFVKPMGPLANGCPSYAILYLNRNTLGSPIEVSFDLPALISSSSAAIEVALRRAKSERSTKDCVNLFLNQASETLSYQVENFLSKEPQQQTLNKTTEIKLVVPPSGVNGIKIIARSDASS